MGDNPVYEKVKAQFAPNASAYATSPTHSDQRSLDMLVELVQPSSTDLLLDVATGAGHTGLAFAPKVLRVTGYDLTPSMLTEASRLAAEKGIKNFDVLEGRAEEIPLADASLDIVTVRTAPHHFADVPAFLRETFRILKPGGKFLFVDTTVPEEAGIAAEINRLERLRDPSHGRNFSAQEIKRMIEEAGFTVTSLKEGWHAEGKKMEVHQWMNRINAPEENREELLGAFTDPTPELVEALDIERRDEAIWFSLPEVTLLAIK